MKTYLNQSLEFLIIKKYLDRFNKIIINKMMLEMIEIILV